jgi:hypothetical protein
MVTPMRLNGSFQIHALAAERFASLFAQTDDQLRTQRIRRVTVDEKPGFPCRVSLADAEVGERVLLLSFVHHDVDSPYRSAGPIYVRPNVPTARPAVNEVPAMLVNRLLSVRAYDREGMLSAAMVIDGLQLEPTIGSLFSQEDIEYLHIHNARPGCFNCSVTRVQ